MRTDRQNLSSEKIKKNFKNIKSEKYIHIKVLTILSVLLIVYMLYVLFNKDDRPGSENGQTTTVSMQDSTFVDSTTIIPKKKAKKTIPVRIYASSIDELREKISRISSNYLMNGAYTPENASLRISGNSFSCRFIEDSSQFIKLSLVWGPKSSGCESCANVLAKNPGSRVLVHKEDAQFIYEVIAISQ